jgi:glycosyltransferase involved in cell wall biosynthesis
MPVILHIHWLELLYASSSLVRSVRLLAAVMGRISAAKAMGCKLVYTVHNLSPHERAFPYLDRIANRVLLRFSDALHVHDQKAKEDLVRRWGPHKRIYMVPHGSYIGAYVNQCTRQEARNRLGLAATAFVYLFLGQIRRYKGIEHLAVAFSQLAGDSCQLVIAGNVHDPVYAQSLAQIAQESPGIRAWFRYVPDAEVQYFMNACDVCVLPYHDVTTSGAAILAFSFGKPIIAPALGGFPELAAGGRGIIYDPLADGSLLEALQEARGTDMTKGGEKALLWAREHQWQTLAPQFAHIYAEVLGHRS